MVIKDVSFTGFVSKNVFHYYTGPIQWLKNNSELLVCVSVVGSAIFGKLDGVCEVLLYALSHLLQYLPESQSQELVGLVSRVY